MDLTEILASMVAEDGLSVALVAGTDGLVVDGQSRGSGIDLPALAAMAARSLVDLDSIGKSVSGGALNRLRLHFESYQLLIETVTSTDLLIAGVSNASDGGRLLDSVARYRQQLQELLGDL
jgi:predicted regulator of Ras-like GTPase activity (Roadblock/LC7/MglB family)